MYNRTRSGRTRSSISYLQHGRFIHTTQALLNANDAAKLVEPIGGVRRDRTDDLMLAKHALSQLSYDPFWVVAGDTPAARRPPATGGPSTELPNTDLPNIALDMRGGPGKT